MPRLSEHCRSELNQTAKNRLTVNLLNCLSLFIDNVDFQTKKTRDSDYRLTALSVSAEVRALATPAATGVRCGQIGLSVNYNDHA